MVGRKFHWGVYVGTAAFAGPVERSSTVLPQALKSSGERVISLRQRRLAALGGTAEAAIPT